MPTPVEHYETAERILVQAEDLVDVGEAGLAIAAAQAHATLAAVAWGADDRDLEEVARGLDGQQVAALVAVVEELHTWAHTPANYPAPDTTDGMGSDDAYVAAHEAARERIGALVDPIAREVLGA